MKNWLQSHYLALRFSFAYCIKSPFTVLLNCLVTSLTVFLPLGLFIILSNAQQLISYLPISPNLTVFMHIDATKQELASVRSYLTQHGAVKKVEFISKDQALRELTHHSGLENVIAGLSYNPLPDAFSITLQEYSPTTVDELHRTISEKIGVSAVQTDSLWIRRLIALLNICNQLLKVIVFILSISIIMITSNSIRMQVLTRLDEIKVSQLIGATEAFIRRPFLYVAALQGVASGLIACGLVHGVCRYIKPATEALATLYNTQFTLVSIQPITVLLVCIATMMLCLLGAFFSVQRVLRI